MNFESTELTLLVNCLLAGGAVVLLLIPLVAIYMIFTTSRRMNTQLADIRRELHALQQQMQQQTTPREYSPAASPEHESE